MAQFERKPSCWECDMKTCKYGHPLPEGKKAGSKCGSARSEAWRKRVEAAWYAPVYRELAMKPWRIEA